MVELDSSPAPEAALTFAAGAGALGSRVAAELSRLLADCPEGLRRCFAVWDATSAGISLQDALTELRSAENLERLQQLGFQIPARSLGTSLRLTAFMIADVQENEAVERVAAAAKDLAASGLGVESIAVGLSGSGLDANALAAFADLTRCDVALPFCGEDATGAQRTEEDLVATTSRTVLLLALPSLRGQLRRPPRASGSQGTELPLITASGAFLDARTEMLTESLLRHAAARLLHRQFDDPRRFTPEASFDPDGVTTATELLKPMRIASALLADTPFALAERRDGSWELRLSSRVTAAELHGLPPRGWIRVLKKLKDFFDFARAARWRESLLERELELSKSLSQALVSDVTSLHRHVRGADRVLAWAERVRNVLDTPVDIVTPAVLDFEAKVENLAREIQMAPSSMATGARIGLIGAIGAAGGYWATGELFGQIAALAAAGTLLLSAVLAGVWQSHSAFQALMLRREAALAALCGHFEEQMRINVLLVLGRLRQQLNTQLSELIRVHRETLPQRANVEAEKLVREEDPDVTAVVVHVDWPVPAELHEDLLEHLQLRWEDLLSAAAAAGTLVPVIDAQGSWNVSAEGLLRFVKSYVHAQDLTFGLSRQVAFRASREPGYLAKICDDLERRSRALAGPHMGSRKWLAPPDLIVPLGQVLPEGVEVEPIPFELLACLRVAEAVVPLRDTPS